jgi:hypothetical protein
LSTNRSAGTAALASTHEQIQPLPEVADAVGASLKLMAHGDGLLRAHIGAAPAVGAAATEVLQDADFLADIHHQDRARRAVVGTAGAANALGRVEDWPATELIRHGSGLRGIGQRNAPRLQADHGFFQFAQH